jgi:hypothetical protein
MSKKVNLTTTEHREGQRQQGRHGQRESQPDTKSVINAEGSEGGLGLNFVRKRKLFQVHSSLI